MITVDEALSIVLGQVEALGAETVPLEQANARILAEDVRADIDLPPFDRARMDGYAVRSADVTTAPVSLNLIGEIAAGAKFPGKLNPGEAVKIFTGAPVPEGADGVQKVEVTRSDGRTVEISEPVKPGQFITPRASEVAAGDLIAERGCEIRPAVMAVLASFGYAEVKVGRRPRVAVLSTGSELIEVSAKPSGAQIRNSNSYALASYAARSGATVDLLGTVEDTHQATVKALLDAAEGRDMVITSGGVSMGDYDLVKGALKEMGAEVYFEKVIIRPGKPTVFARRDQTYFFGLPGNPVSTSVTFNVFARPAIRKMQGERNPLLPTVRAVLARPVKDMSGRRSYLPARLVIENGRALAEPLKWGGSSDLVAFMQSDALIIVREESHDLAEGEAVDVVLLDTIAERR
ncbi:MAG TPA: gephyrin-like molybdotransferase Glp [Blastocatellia bacterium]|jgi:molybdenum cofactor synthesis domain-containing protein|nr:gephyrin-like molybdotransferase Glp [Blastocatellia bacterium]